MNSENDSATGGGSEKLIWGLIALSGDGRYQIAIVDQAKPDGHLAVSSDFGQNWNDVDIDLALPLAAQWAAVSMSDDGKYQTAVAGRSSVRGAMYVSSDYGVTWEKIDSAHQRAGLDDISNDYSWNDVDMSADGRFQIATGDDGVYYSIDYGSHWAKVSLLSDGDRVAVSKNGEVAVITDGARVMVSVDHGASWMPSASFYGEHTGLGSLELSISDDGNRWVVADHSSNGAHIHITNDRGATWITKGSAGLWWEVAITGDGTKIAAAYSTSLGSPKYTYLSSDLGDTWENKGDVVFWSKTINDGYSNFTVYNHGFYVAHDSPVVPSVEYGVDIDESTGFMSGYAWSENIGWVSFNAADAAGCLLGECKAWVDSERKVHGWARVVSVKDDPGNAGGWYGWIRLRDEENDKYGVIIDSTGDFHGWAWSDMVLGWLSFNSVDAGAGGGPYKVFTAAGIDLEAKMECGGDCLGGICAEPTWVAYPPVGCPACVFEFRNKSKGDVRCAYWELTGPATYSYSAPMPLMTINLSAFGSNLVPGDYELRLTVSNDSSVANCSAGVADSVTHPVHIKQEAVADFECAFDNTALTIWQDCTSAAGKVDFAKKMVKGGKVYVRGDNSSGSHYSVPSEDATAITDYNWTFTVDGAVLAATGNIASFVAGKNNKISLIAEDNSSTTAGGRNGCITVDLGARSLPKWQEISPVGMIWNHIIAGIAKIFATI